MAITDLTGTTWQFKNTIPSNTEYPEGNINLRVSFTSNGENMKRLSVSNVRNPQVMYYVYVDDNQFRAYDPYNYQFSYGRNWLADAYRTIVILGGTDVTNIEKIRWLEAVADLVRKECIVEYRIANGTWADGTTAPIRTIVREGDVPSDVPVGMIPNPGYETGEWSPDPYITVVSGNIFFEYIYRRPGCIVEYRITNGRWANGRDNPITENVAIGGTPQEVPTGMRPLPGYIDGEWDNDPSSAIIRDDTTFTYAYKKIVPPPITDCMLLYKVVNGTWADGTVEYKSERVDIGRMPTNVPTGMIPLDGFGDGEWSPNPNVPAYQDRTFFYSFKRVAPGEGIGSFVFGGISSLDFGLIYIGGQNTYNAPQRDVTKISVPGRNGDLIQDNGRFLNVSVPYNIVVMQKFRERTDEIKAWLLGDSEYRKLVDTYHPGTYRMARVSDNISFSTSAYNLTGKTQVVFDCKPQRFLDSGDEVIEITSATDKIVNPTEFPSEPIIKIYVSGIEDGSAWLIINDTEITIFSVDEYVTIDSQLKECYKDGKNRNNNIIFTDYKFPTLKPESNNISFSSGITKLEIIPKWWTI